MPDKEKITSLLRAAQAGDDLAFAELVRAYQDIAVYRSTPLGYAARWGRREMVAFLLERGADANKSGEPWATPLAWARKKGYADIEADLRQAGAR